MCMTSAGGPGTSSATGCWRSCAVASLCPVRDTDRDVQLRPPLTAAGGHQMCTTLEDVVSMFCHLLTGSATTSQSGQAAWRSLARVDFPTADDWEVVKQGGQLLAHTLPSYFEIQYLPMFPSIETLFTLAALSSLELEWNFGQDKPCVPDFWAIGVTNVLRVRAPFPPGRTLLAVIRRRGVVLWPNRVTWAKHVCFLNAETALKRKQRRREDILAQ